MRMTLITVAICALVGGTVQAEVMRIGLAAEPYPPSAWIDEKTGKWVGFEIDMADELCAIAELECVWVTVPWDGIIDGLLNNEYDVIISAMAITEPRRRIIDFSDPYWVTDGYQPVLLGRKSLSVSGNLASLKGMVVGLQQDTVYQDYAEKHLASFIAEWRGFAAHDDAVNALLTGEVDLVLDGESAFDGFLAKSEGECCELKAEMPADSVVIGLGSGIGLRKGDDDLRERLNGAIAQLIVTGRMQELFDAYVEDSDS